MNAYWCFWSLKECESEAGNRAWRVRKEDEKVESRRVSVYPEPSGEPSLTDVLFVFARVSRPIRARKATLFSDGRRQREALSHLDKDMSEPVTYIACIASFIEAALSQLTGAVVVVQRWKKVEQVD